MIPEKILVIEDDKPTLLALKLALTAAGYEVALAVDAISAVTIASKEKPDLIISDIGLPCGNGFVVMSRIRALLPLLDVPIIIVTSHQNCEQQALAAGAAAFFRKPADLDALTQAVARLLPSGSTSAMAA